MMREVSLEEAVQVLKQGQLLIYPTETSYGLGALPSHHQALEKILEIKKREASKGLILLVNSMSQAESLVLKISPLAKKLMEQFWPGPLTLLLPANLALNPILTGRSGWIALRQSPHPQVKTLLQKLKEPLISTSANPAGEEPAFTVSQVEAYFGDQDLAFLSGGDLQLGPSSTLLKVEGERVEWIREGALTKAKLRTKL